MIHQKEAQGLLTKCQKLRQEIDAAERKADGDGYTCEHCVSTFVLCIGHIRRRHAEAVGCSGVRGVLMCSRVSRGSGPGFRGSGACQIQGVRVAGV